MAKLGIVKRSRRLSSKGGWMIAIDDGFVCYKYSLEVNGRYCIESLFNKIKKSVVSKKRKRKKARRRYE